MAGLLALLITALGAGMIARRTRVFPAQTPQALNALVLYVALPALVLRAMHQVSLSTSLLGGAAMLWLQFLLAIGFFALAGRMAKLSRGTVGALILTGGLSNTAFIGLPLIGAVLGAEALGVAVFVDQLGSFLTVSLLGMTVAARLSGHSTDARAVLKRVVLFPSFIALVAALLLRPVAFPEWLDVLLHRLGDLLTPLALFSVGFQLRVTGLRERARPLALGLAFKLVLAPVVLAAVFALFAPPFSMAWNVTLLQVAMPPMVTGGILAAQYELDPPLAAAMIGLGIPVSAATLAIAIAVIT